MSLRTVSAAQNKRSVNDLWGGPQAHREGGGPQGPSQRPAPAGPGHEEAQGCFEETRGSHSPPTAAAQLFGKGSRDGNR